jgi:chromosome segregation ATPase
MNPLPYIEKWISEHGSAAILRDHVALLKSQMDALQTEVSNLQARLKEAETERNGSKAQSEQLQTQLDDARKEIERLKQPTSRRMDRFNIAGGGSTSMLPPREPGDGVLPAESCL